MSELKYRYQALRRFDNRFAAKVIFPLEPEISCPGFAAELDFSAELRQVSFILANEPCNKYQGSKYHFDTCMDLKVRA